MAGHRYHAAILGTLIALPAGCAEPATHPPTWASLRAEGQLDRALQAEARRDFQAARELAVAALEESQAAVNVSASARSMALIGRLTGDHLMLLDAIDLLTALDEDEALVRAHIDLAALAVEGGQLPMAAAQLDTALTRLDEAGLERRPNAVLAALVWHTYAAGLRKAGAREAALSRERQANLMLSVLDDSEMQRLRLEVAQRLGDDLAATSDPRQAFQQHSRASALARELEDRRAELIAITSLTQDLEAMERYRDAVDHCGRALDIALELGEDARAATLARRALQMLMSLGERPGSERWERFSAHLDRG
ncbi:MAG: hypothetical protein ACYTCU_00090 [Planctomycetota bacterium]